ncbi:hypothetical protein ACKF11_09380 [Methylobacillus sp. Pita2]|uniref:hypothetical protein n=1 Tax=Methylobacillus sp. Pita2 TaxID=3383245 RepID=UPI0038B5C977
MFEKRRKLIKSSVILLLSYLAPKTAFAAASPVLGNKDFIKELDEVLAGNKDLVEGNYEITNPLTISYRSGTAKFSPNFELKLLNNRATGIVFSRCSNLKLIGGSFSHKTNPAGRIGHGGILEFSGCNNVVVQDGVYFQAPATGLIFTLCNDCTAQNIQIWDTWADGLHFANCNNPIALDYSCLNTGDDGLAFVNYGKHPDASGGYANNIVVNGSYARGIAIIGQSNVTVERFYVNGTSGAGVKIGAESYYKTRIPSNITIKNGVIENAGQFCATKVNPHGFYSENSSGKIIAENLKISNAKAHGTLIARHDGDLILKKFDLLNIPSSGITATCENADISDITMANIGTSPIYFVKVAKAVVSDIKVGTYGTINSSNPLIWATQAQSLVVSKVQLTAQPRSVVRIGGSNINYHSVNDVSSLAGLSAKLLEDFK